MSRWFLPVILCVLSLAATTLSAAEGDNRWPQFRGPTGLGSTSQELPLTWSIKTGENVRWHKPLVGSGHASPIVWGDRVYVCTAYWAPGIKDRPKVMPEHHLLCYDAENGDLKWDTMIPPGPWLRGDFRSGAGGGYAAPTPTTDGQRIYVAYGSSVIAAVDLNGQIVWRKEIVPHTFDVTLGSSPVLFGDTVILLCAMSQKKDSKLIAYKTATGEIAWEKPLPKTGFGHSTPLLIDVAGKKQLIVVASDRSDESIQSFDPANGERIWWCKGAGEAASPAYGDGLLYIDSGRGGPGFCVDVTGQGDVTATHIKWEVNQVPEAIGSPVIANGCVFRLHNPGVLKCWDLKTGEQKFQQRISASTTWASPILAGDRLYFASAGKSVVVAAAPEFKLLAENDLGDPNHPSPAVAFGRLYLAGEKELFCVGTK